ncbi:hypothetical protein GW17_00026692 [Ensete ventricosum]|nr:hypothetical protein GW17_00026692 [Ensete ventricosum]RZR82716.1 hypothetical protein BHM03_00009194 [Ensete ventricosum]
MYMFPRFASLVTMQAQKEAPPDMQCKDKFLLQSVITEHGATIKDITSEMVLTFVRFISISDLLRKERGMHHGGFSVTFVVLVGLLGALIGYIIKKS